MTGHRRLVLIFAIMGTTVAGLALAQEKRVELDAKMVTNETKIGDPTSLVDEQIEIIGPPAGQPAKGWRVGGQHSKDFPLSVSLDLGEVKNLSKLWIFDTNGSGDVDISYGQPGKWTKLTTYGCNAYMKWVPIDMNVSTRYIQLTRKTPNANFTEIAVYEYTPEAWKELQAQKAQAAQKEAERQAALKKATDEVKKRPLVDLGEPFGKLYLVDEVDCAQTPPDHEFHEDPAGVSKVETILGKKCRVLPPTVGEGAYFSYNLGKMKLLQPGASYVLSVEYPEDQPRMMIVSNRGNETIRGFHTGLAVGDSFHPKYVGNHNESINTPLSGKWENWTQLFRLHDRFLPYNGVPKGSMERSFLPEDGFSVTISQFSAKNIPMSKGAAVSKIRLFAVLEPETLNQKINYPAKDLPRRRLFWREEMADGVIGEGKKRPPETRGVENFLDWYKYKAQRMKFLGMNTFSKDLLEFGACQGWDSTPYGGHDWVYYGDDIKHWWAAIVELMGKEGFEVFPYYEYSGSKGKNGLGFQRRCKPLNRPDGYYTHIKWVEKATADITDPDTYVDFKKMLDLTVIRLKDKAKFTGVWLRPRSQLPVSFADATLKRFNTETKQPKPVTREMLVKDKALYASYLQWWELKRRDFLTAMRDHLRKNGVEDAMVLFTGCSSEPGVGFGSWDPVMVTDTPDAWKPVLAKEEHQAGEGKSIKPLTVDEVVQKDMYLKGLLSPGLDWGDYEVRHARPADDPQNYKDVEGVLLSQAYNRMYTVASPKTFDAYRAPSGLAILRYYALNENMMFDKQDKNKLGYFVADIEKAGPYCMMSEALAVANGDPTMIGYLSGGNYARGFPKYVRNFNAAFLSLPALPSDVVKDAASDAAVVVRQIKTPKDGVYMAVVNTAMTDKKDVTITLPAQGTVTDAATGQPLTAENGKVTLTFYPYQLRSIHIQTK